MSVHQKRIDQNTGMKNKFFIFIILMILMHACLPASSKNTPTPDDLPSSTLTPGPELVATPGEILSTDTPREISTSDPASTTIPGSTCPKREAGLPPDFLAPGTIIFRESEGFLLESKDHLYSISSQDFEPRPFLDDLMSGVFSSLHVSPDGKWLAFRHEKLDGQHMLGHDLILTASNDQEQKTIPWDEENWGYIYGWLANDQRLLIQPHFDSGTTRQDEIILFDPFTGQQERISPAFSYPENSYFIYSTGQTVFYDPTLTRVAYQEDDYTLILWDLEQEREIWRFVEPIIIHWDEPSWSPDGEFMVVVDSLSDKKYPIDLNENDSFQTIIVNRDGEVIWQDAYPYYKEWFLSTLFTWSPDGRYLVFSRKAPNKEESRILLLDTSSMEVLDYCITGIAASPIIWSPDSQQFIVQIAESTTANGEEVYQNLVVDVIRRVIVKLEKVTLRPEAWIVTTP